MSLFGFRCVFILLAAAERDGGSLQGGQLIFSNRCYCTNLFKTRLYLTFIVNRRILFGSCLADRIVATTVHIVVSWDISVKHFFLINLNEFVQFGFVY